MKSFWNEFLTSNDTLYRLARTILQGVIGVLIANADLLVSTFNFEPQVRALIVALVMAILSPIMSEFGAAIETNDKPIGYTIWQDIPERTGGDDNDDRSET